MSTRTGSTFYFNEARKLSLWHDATLPPGWAWGRESSSAPVFYYHMATNTRQSTKPTASDPAPVAASTAPAPAPAVARKRPREEDGAGVPSRVKTTGGAGGPADAADAQGAHTSVAAEVLRQPKKGASFALAPRPPAIDEEAEGFPDAPPDGVKPEDAKEFDGLFFDDSHRRVLKELLGPGLDTVMEIGCGCGEATRFILDRLPAVQILAADIFDTEYAVHILKAVGAGTAAARLEGQRLFDLFVASMWERRGVVALMRMEAIQAINDSRRIGFKPKLFYIDGPLHYSAAKCVLERAVHCFPEASFVGGGWDLSPGLRRAVAEVAEAKGWPLHVEDGKCWTFSVLAERASADPEQWYQRVLAELNRGDSVQGLARAIGDSAHRTEGGSSGLPWIDRGGKDKRRLTLLGVAAKLGRKACTEALIDVHGANVNQQSPISLFSPVLLAAYNGNPNCTKALLKRGADPTLKNKYNEDALAAARQGKSTNHARCVQYIEEALKARGAQ